MRAAALRVPGLPPVHVGGGTVASVALVAVLMYPAMYAAAGGDVLLAAVFAALMGLGMLLSVAIHEAAHALMATAFGARVDHIALTVLGGHTQYRGPHLNAWRSTLISLAGPVSNLVLGALAAGAELVLDPGALAASMLFLLSALNYALAIFNLLPGLPLDGGRALEAAVGALTRRRWLGTVIAGWAGRLLALAMVALALLRILRPTEDQDPTAGILLMVILLMIAAQLWAGASEGLRRARLQRSAESTRLESLLEPAVIIRSGTMLSDVPSTALHDKTVLVPRAQHWLRLDPAALAHVPLEQYSRTPVDSAARLVAQTAVVGQDDAVGLAVQLRAARRPVTLVVIDTAGRPVGVISPDA